MLNRNLADAAPQIFSAPPSSYQSLASSTVESLRSALRKFATRRRQRRERKELYEFLAGDHRIAADIGYRHLRE